MRSRQPQITLPHVVLIGGGHSHVQVLRRHRERPFRARLSIVLDQPESVYSGMVPGFVAGNYAAADLTIDVWALARTADVRIVDGLALKVDTERARIEVEGRRTVSFDTVSIDIGSTVAGLTLKGVREHALATRPIARFVEQLDVRLASLSPGDDQPILVVGAGAAGFELAYCLNARTGRPVIVISEPSPAILHVAPARLQARRPGVTFRQGRVEEVTHRGVVLESHEEIPGALVVWAAGAAPLPLGEASGVPCVGGYIEAGPTLQVAGRPNVFAVGDCAHFLQTHGSGRGNPLPKAGVYAVRMGPFLCDNLEARLSGTDLRPFVPQRDFLSLLNLGDGTAVGRRSGVRVEGKWVWRLKDRIDRRFMQMFQVVDLTGQPLGMAGAGDDEMECGGCAAKVGATELHRALSALPPIPADATVELGLETADDAAVVRTPGGDRLGLSVDAFTAFCDDPWVVGRVATVNALNDLYVKGITPRWAMATVAVPDVPGVLDEVMAGVRRGLDDLGISLIGGHTLRCDELCVGLAVTGTLDRPLSSGRLYDDDVFVLTRGLGSGVLLRANAMGRARGVWVHEALRWMMRSHREASRVLAGLDVQAATDVTGFGLYGHLAALLARSGAVGGPCGAEIEVAELPLFPGASALFGQGVRSTFHVQNERSVSVSGPGVAHSLSGLGYDPQTAGPLLFAVPAHRLATVLAALAAEGEPARRIGGVVPAPGIRLV